MPYAIFALFVGRNATYKRTMPLSTHAYHRHAVQCELNEERIRFSRVSAGDFR